MCNLTLQVVLTPNLPFEHIYARVDEKTSRQGAKTQRLIQEQIRPFEAILRLISALKCEAFGPEKVRSRKKERRIDTGV